MNPIPPMKVIARIHSDFKEKFGIPRQSGLVEELEAEIVFEPEYRNPDALRGLEEFSHIWLIWLFSASVREGGSPTVRPPRLGGNERMGVFATRSPFRPNEIGLSSVKLLRVEQDGERGPVLRVAGADLMDGTPILDIKPYLPYADSHPEAIGGFADSVQRKYLEVAFPEDACPGMPAEKREALKKVLAEDPRPSYQRDPKRVYGMNFAGYEVKFRVRGNELQVLEGRGRQNIASRRYDLREAKLWGETCPLRIERSLKPPLTQWADGEIYLRVRAKSTEVEQQKQLDSWYQEQMEERMRELVPRYESIVGKHADAWAFRRMKSRWGFCHIQKKKICLNIELAERPPECLEYVIVHELTHLHEAGHNKRFWSLVGQFYPDYQRVRESMKA